MVAAALTEQPSTPLRLLQAEILLSQGQARKAYGLITTIGDQKDPELHLRYLVDSADALVKTGRAEQGIAVLKNVEQLPGLPNVEPRFKGALLRGAMLSQAGHFEEAETLLKATAEKARAAKDGFNEAAAMLNLSFLWLKRERYDASLEYSSAAVRAATQAGATRLVALADNNLGIAYTALGDVDKAEEQQVGAVAQLRKIGDLRNLQDALGELGNVYLLLHQPGNSQKHFEEAFSISNQIEAFADAGRWAGQMAMAQIEQGQWVAAAEWNHKAHEAFNRDHHDIERLHLRLNEAEIAVGTGHIDEAAKLYRSLVHDAAPTSYPSWKAHVRLASLLAGEKQYREANQEFERGLAAIEQLRSNLLSPDFRIRFQDQKMEFFRDYVDLLVSEGQGEHALQIAEQSRARVLAEGLAQTSVPSKTRPTSFPQLARGKVVLSYWLAPKRSFAWLIRSNGVLMRELPGEPQIAELVNAYRKAIEQDLRDPVQTAMPQGTRLREILVAPFEKELSSTKEIVIIPDGILHTVNMETLPGRDEGRYWIEDVELSIAPSLTLLSEAARRPDTARSLLMVGAPESAVPEYPALPGADTEISAIQQRLNSLPRVIQSGKAATPKAFLDANPERFSMIHFAAHAEANAKSPLESAVILSKGSTGYKLYAHDIARLKLSADLVTLSACRSAGARRFAGEGPVGFAWAFLQAGATSVIAGLWDVGDASSVKLMDQLYSGLSSGLTPSASLRAAKLALLHSGGANHKPFYWAPHQIYSR